MVTWTGFDSAASQGHNKVSCKVERKAFHVLQCCFSKLCVSPHSDASLHSISAKGASPGNSKLKVPIAASTAPWAIAAINTQHRAAKAGRRGSKFSSCAKYFFFCGTATI